jgi:hypothetical protein
MNAELAAFLDSLKSGTPPSDATPLLHAVWHGLRGEWEAAHQIAQEDASSEGAWVHAWLHRTEGDFSNARYWCRQGSAGHGRRRSPRGRKGYCRVSTETLINHPSYANS